MALTNSAGGFPGPCHEFRCPLHSDNLPTSCGKPGCCWVPWHAGDSSTSLPEVSRERGFFPPFLVSPVRGVSISAGQTGSFAAEARGGEEPLRGGGVSTSSTGSQRARGRRDVMLRAGGAQQMPRGPGRGWGQNHGAGGGCSSGTGPGLVGRQPGTSAGRSLKMPFFPRNACPAARLAVGDLRRAPASRLSPPGRAPPSRLSRGC